MNNVGIFGVPRSGTSWLGHIFNSHPDVVLRFQPLFSYGHKGSLTEHSTVDEIRKFFEQILNSQDAFATMASETQRNYPIFKKSASPTHIAFKETRYLHVIENILARFADVKIIGIVRNPLAVLASWVSAPREYKPEWDIISEWREAASKNLNKPEEYFGFEKWKSATEAFLRYETQYPNQFALVRYGDLNNAPVDNTKRLFDFCELDICEQVETFLNASKSRHDSDPYSVFRGQANDDNWRHILPGEIVRQIKIELKDTALGVFLQGNTNE